MVCFAQFHCSHLNSEWKKISFQQLSSNALASAARVGSAAMMLKSLPKRHLHVVVASPHLHGILAPPWNLRPWPPVHNP